MQECKNLKYNEDGTIDCELNHPELGWIPFTASPNDVEALGKEIFARAKAGDYGVVAAHQPPTQVEIDARKRAHENAEARKYLAETDWYIIRNIETGTPIPENISTARAAAWLKVTD